MSTSLISLQQLATRRVVLYTVVSAVLGAFAAGLIGGLTAPPGSTTDDIFVRAAKWAAIGGLLTAAIVGLVLYLLMARSKRMTERALVATSTTMPSVTTTTTTMPSATVSSVTVAPAPSVAVPETDAALLRCQQQNEALKAQHAEEIATVQRQSEAWRGLANSNLQGQNAWKSRYFDCQMGLTAGTTTTTTAAS